MRAIAIIAAVLMAETGVAADDPLATAKDLYASAAYEEALSALNGVNRAASAEEARQADQYRAFCLYALGRTGEAESIAEGLIRQQPLAQLDAGEASPRLEKMFADVRTRLLPSLIRDRFRSAKSALDEKRFGAAEPALLDTSLMLAEAGRVGVKDDTLADLAILVDGFLQLIRTTAAPQQQAPTVAATAPAPPVPAPAPIVPPRAAAAAAPVPPPARAARPPAVTAASAEPGDARVYSIADKDVTPPTPLEQSMPVMPGDILQIVRFSRATGIIDLLIDETGKVLDATLRQSLNVAFDPQLLRSARRWRYTPAMKDGAPVRFIKTVAVVP